MIQFNDKQWDRVIANYKKWWKGELNRPILPMVIHGRDPGRPMPPAPALSFATCGDFDIPAKDVIDRIDWGLSSLEYYGDSYPWVNMYHFGAGVTAAFLGAKVNPTKNTVWFSSEKKVPIEELHFEYDEGNIWLRRIKDIYKAGKEKWGDSVCMSMTDLGGTLDILASFTDTEDLLFHLIDNPKEVRRLCTEINELWIRYYKEFNDLLGHQRVFSDWATMLWEKPTYMTQCDFCYMIGNDMFKDFVKDDLAYISAAVGETFYHLDGPGQLIHLDDILKIDEIKGIQWIPGAGDPEARDWSDIYRKISYSGKKIMAQFDMNKYLDKIIAVINKPDDLVKMMFSYPAEEKEAALKKLAAYGALD